MSQEVVQRSPQQELVGQLRSDEFRSQVALALPENVTPERFTRIAITALQASPSLAELERASVLRSLLDSAAMGLMPDNREAAIVPFKGKAQLIPMIAGFRKIAADFGWTIYTAIAYEHDVFEYEQGLDVRFRHVPVRPGVERGAPIAAYAVGKHSDGRRELEVLTVAEVEKIRATSQTGAREDSPWAQWWEQMAEKSAGKRLFKKLPLSEDDKRVRIVRAAVDPADAATAIYGESARAALAPADVDSETGEILPASSGSADAEGAPSPSGSQAEEVAPQTPQSPAASSVPDTDPEPLAEDEHGQTVIPAGGYAGQTLAEVAEKGGRGEEWLAWASRNPQHSNVGPAVHAALQHFRPGLFDAKEA